MVVNGLTLPASFERYIRRADVQLYGLLTKEGSDAYGNYWDPSSLEFYTDPGTMKERTAGLADVLADRVKTEAQIAERNARSADEPGAIPFITDFSRILLFGQNGAGDHLGFDYRDNPDQPSVIFMEEWYWRRVAPDFDTFVDLLEPWDYSKSMEEREDREMQLWEKFHGTEDASHEADPLALAAPEPVEPTAPVPPLAGQREPMIVNGWSLPTAFQVFLDQYPTRVWDLKPSADTSGLPERTFIPITTVEQITTATVTIAKAFRRVMERGMALVGSEADSPGREPGPDPRPGAG